MYSLDQHGVSINTLYDRVHAGMRQVAGGCVLVVRDCRGRIFGAYVSESLKKSWMIRSETRFSGLQ